MEQKDARFPGGQSIPWHVEAAAKTQQCYRDEQFARLCSEIPRRLGRVAVSELAADKRFWSRARFLYGGLTVFWLEIVTPKEFPLLFTEQTAKIISRFDWANAKLTAALEDKAAVSARLESLGEPQLARRVAHLYAREVEGLERILR